MMMGVEQPVEWELVRETGVLGEKHRSATNSTWRDVGWNPGGRGLTLLLKS